MLFFVEVERQADHWSVAYSEAGVSPLLERGSAKALVRRLPKCGASSYPQPPAGEAAAVAETDAHHALCTTGDAADIARLAKDFVDKVPARTRADGMVVLGRYLFATLIGDAAWTEIRNRAAGQPIELALSWRTGELSAFPWEVMHDGERFLAQRLKREARL